MSEVVRNPSGPRRRVTWEERVQNVLLHYPSITRLDWFKGFDQDDGLFGAFMRDIIRMDQSPAGKSGPRFGIEVDINRYRQLTGQDYSTLRFQEIFPIMCRGQSITQVSRKTSLARTRVHRLLKGEMEPTTDDLIRIAKGFRKDPSFFVEYRAAFITAAMTMRLEGAPEASITMYRKLTS